MVISCRFQPIYYLLHQIFQQLLYAIRRQLASQAKGLIL